MKTSQGLIELLQRLGIKPTFDRVKDIELAKIKMPKPFNELNSKEL